MAFSIKMNAEDLQKQIQGYDTLGIKSSRGISAALIMFSVVITVLLIVFKILESAALIEVLIMVGLAYFVYKGKRWAIITIMVLWTIEKALQVIGGGSIIAIAWWGVFMYFFYRALQVENARKQITPA